MTSMFSVTFLGKEFEFPSDILVLKKEYDYLADEQETCLSHFDANFTSKVVSEEVLYNGLKYYAEHYIQKLCDQGIYDKSIDDYIYNNEGYKHCLEMNSGATETLKVIKQEAQNALSEADEAAQSAAAASVTGSGVQVYSSSLTTLFAHAVAENVTVNSQTKKAIEQYNSQMRTARAKTNAWIDGMQGNYFEKTYRPAMQGAILAAISNMTQKYLTDLAEHGLFDLSVTKYFEIDRSNALVQNLKMIADKKSVLLQAFGAYPFNLNVYIESAKLGLFSETDVGAAKTFNIYDELSKHFISCPNCGFQYICKNTETCPECGTKIKEYTTQQLINKRNKELSDNNEKRNEILKEKISKYKEKEQSIMAQIPATKKELSKAYNTEHMYEFTLKASLISFALFSIIVIISDEISGFKIFSMIAAILSGIISISTFMGKKDYIDQQYKTVIKGNPEEYKKEKLKQIMEEEMRKIKEEIDEEYDKKEKEIRKKYDNEIEKFQRM